MVPHSGGSARKASWPFPVNEIGTTSVTPPQSMLSCQPPSTLLVAGIAACWQPVLGLHVPVVQASTSSQVIGVCTHPLAGSQASAVQAFPSSQSAGAYWQSPARHVAVAMQGSPGSQSAAVPQACGAMAMPAGVVPTAIVAVTARVPVSTTETVVPPPEKLPRFV